MSKSKIEEIRDKYNTKEHEILRNTFGTPDTHQDIQTLLEEIDLLNAKDVKHDFNKAQSQQDNLMIQDLLHTNDKLQSKLSSLEEQAQALVVHLKLISQMESPMGFAGCPTIARQALEAYEAWKSNNGGGG